LRSEVNLIEAYTASLKGAAIVSSSQQITNYYKFAETASANTFYGNVGFGAAATNGKVEIQQSATTPGLWVQTGGTTNSYVIADFRTGTNASALKVIGDSNVSTDGNLIFTSGKGIDFSATANSAGTMTSELLNDYEEGTWTPVIEGETTNPTLTGYSTQVGRYTKIGRVVTIHCALQPAGTSVAGTGNLRFGGLPFTSANIADVIGTGVAATNGDFNWGSGKTQLAFSVPSNSSKISVWGMQNGTTEAGIPVNNFNNSNQYLLFSITYMAS
jgi:hypothetical protein